MIKIAIAGYGSVGRGVEYAVEQSRDMELTAIFTRRPGQVKTRTTTPVLSLEQAAAWRGRVDVLILCGGSHSDLPTQGPTLAQYFHTVDSFDIHPDIPRYFADMDAALNASGKLGLIAAGWDPGLFSLSRLYCSAMLPEGQSYTFWGRGISQGHSNALRQVEGVRDAVQYTCPIESAVAQVRSGSMPKLSAAETHIRECYVVLQDGADATQVAHDIITMPYYFENHITKLHFVSPQEFQEKHGNTATGGFVFRSGRTGQGNTHHMEFALQTDANPEFTAAVLVAYARAVARMAADGRKGAITVFDVAPALLSAQSGASLLAEVL